MTRSSRLGVILSYLRNRERDAARALGQRQGRLAQTRNVLHQLETYQAEFLEAGVPNDIRSVQALVQRGNFLDAMDAAIGDQNHAVVAVTAEYQECKQQWLQRRTRRRALGRAVTRLVRQEQLAESRREQRGADDLVARAATRGFSKKEI